MSDLRDDSRCARCGTAFRCGIGDAGGCWCAGLPPLPRERLDADAGCLCPACLARIFHQTGPEFTRKPRLSRRVDD
jgi:DNA-directed RNA polymerase subunit RPC12/RpoP